IGLGQPFRGAHADGDRNLSAATAQCFHLADGGRAGAAKRGVDAVATSRAVNPLFVPIHLFSKTQPVRELLIVANRLPYRSYGSTNPMWNGAGPRYGLYVVRPSQLRCTDFNFSRGQQFGEQGSLSGLERAVPTTVRDTLDKESVADHVIT